MLEAIPSPVITAPFSAGFSSRTSATCHRRQHGFRPVPGGPVRRQKVRSQKSRPPARNATKPSRQRKPASICMSGCARRTDRNMSPECAAPSELAIERQKLEALGQMARRPGPRSQQRPDSHHGLFGTSPQHPAGSARAARNRLERISTYRRGCRPDRRAHAGIPPPQRDCRRRHQRQQ